MERFSLYQRGEELLVFVEVHGEILEVKETLVFQQALVAFLRERGVPTEDLRRMVWQVLGGSPAGRDGCSDWQVASSPFEATHVIDKGVECFRGQGHPR